MRINTFYIVIIGIFLILISCNVKDKECKPKKPKEIFALELGFPPSVTYSHSIYVEGLSKECDSAIVTSVAYDYIQNIAKETPVEGVDIFNSLDSYDRGETLSQPKSFWGDCVVSIWFDKKTMKPREFIFYDQGGNESYKGPRWK